MKGKGSVVDSIRKLEQNREERRAKMEEAKREKDERRKENIERGKNVDIDYQLLIEKNRYGIHKISDHIQATGVKLCVCVRKRPLFKKEQQSGEIDSVSCANPQIKIHEPKYKVDGITKYIENHEFVFDNTFNQEESTDDIYYCALRPLIPSLFRQAAVVTCFAYGQTGSGKTFTMKGITEQVVKDIYDKLNADCFVAVSCFQIYGGRCYDLLNQKIPLTILEDKNGAIQIQGIFEQEANNPKQLFNCFQLANSNRTTHATTANDTSSRSHSISNLIVKTRLGTELGKLILVDLAGSERAQDTQSNNRQRRMQGAEINKSLLALKQCIRGMDQGASHVPFRASKLTLVLRDSFQSKSQDSKILMIACISPGSSSADHSLNTLRYADRLKQKSAVRPIETSELVQLQEREKDRYQKMPAISKSSKEKQIKQLKQVKQVKETRDTKDTKDTKETKKTTHSLEESKDVGRIQSIPNIHRPKEDKKVASSNRAVSKQKVNTSSVPIKAVRQSKPPPVVESKQQFLFDQDRVEKQSINFIRSGQQTGEGRRNCHEGHAQRRRQKKGVP